jgi:hypothetical protein
LDVGAFIFLLESIARAKIAPVIHELSGLIISAGWRSVKEQNASHNGIL